MTGALPSGLLELSPVERGVVSIFGVASRFFVALSNKGKLYGSVSTSGAAPHPAGGGRVLRIPTLQANGNAGRGHRSGSRSDQGQPRHGVWPQDRNREECAIPEWTVPRPSEGAPSSPSVSPWAVSFKADPVEVKFSGCQGPGRWLVHPLL